MQERPRKLILGGDSAFAEIAYEYFTHDSPHDVVAFAVERKYIKRESLFDVPIVAFEDIETRFAPSEHSFYSAHVYTQLNRLRTRFAAEAKAKGYTLTSYISPKAFVWRNVTFGEHCFIFENNVIQPFVKVGSNVVLWSGNHIGHHSIIHDNCFIASHVVVSGFCEIGENTFMGVNATMANNVKIAPDCLIGAGATILRDTLPGKLYGAKATDPKERSALEYFGVEPAKTS